MTGSVSVRVKCEGGQGVVRGLQNDDSLEKLLAQTTESLQLPSHTDLVDLKILSGFPPKPLDLNDLSKSISLAGVKSGDSLILQYSARKPLTPSPFPQNQKVFGEPSASLASNSSSNIQSSPVEAPSNVSKPEYEDKSTKRLKTSSSGPCLERRVVPADNSCLFTSINFCMSGELAGSEHSNFMREIIVSVVSSDLAKYSEAILGKPNSAYCSWIQGKDAWGGAIEVQILAEYFQVEIGVVDIMSGSVTIFGEGNSFPQRMLLLYDGIHYDPLYQKIGPEQRSIFSSGDAEVVNSAKRTAEGLRVAHSYTDTAGFKLKCLVCGHKMRGETEALAHAKQTQHGNFSEV